MVNPMDLSNRRFLVTGASSGIGRGVAIHLSNLGAEVVLVGRNTEKLKETIELMYIGNHSYVQFDLSKLDEIQLLFEKICSVKKLDGFVHSAGIGLTIPIQSMKYEDLHEVMLINFYAFVELSKVFIKKKFNNNGGSIVGISSTASKVSNKGLCAYCASKSAMDSSVRVMAKEFAAKKIRVNTVNPSFIDTDMYKQMKDIISPEGFKELLNRQPLGLGEPLDVANAVAFLLSDAAKFITGTNFSVDGGYLT